MSTISYKDLIVWQKGIDLVDNIYSLTDEFPSREMYCLSDQMRRSAISIVSNIAEGSRRSSRVEFKRFLYISSGSGAELETQIEIAKRRNYHAKEKYEIADDLLDQIMRMLNKLISTLKNNN